MEGKNGGGMGQDYKKNLIQLLHLAISAGYEWTRYGNTCPLALCAVDTPDEKLKNQQIIWDLMMGIY